MSYLDDLRRELSAAGICGALQRRIVAELADHLDSDPGAELGSPATLAGQFADELGSARTRRAAFASFGALAVAGALFAVALTTAGSGFPHRHAHSGLLGTLGATMAVLGAQIALACGTLAAIRALRRRGAAAMPRAEAVIVVRRTAIGLAAGLTAMAGLALLAIEYNQGQSASSTTLALVAAAVGAVALIAAVPAAVSAGRLTPASAGLPGDVFDDLGGMAPSALRGHPWWLAIVLAAAIAVLVTVAGVLQSDPYDGALRGAADAIACLGCFTVLGRYLGLRAARI